MMNITAIAMTVINDRPFIYCSYHHKEITQMRKLNDLRKKGQGLVEYALILVLSAIVVIVILGVLGGQVNSIFSTIASAM